MPPLYKINGTFASGVVYTPVPGPQGPPGSPGPTGVGIPGPQGVPGLSGVLPSVPNGILKGSSGNIALAIGGTDYPGLVTANTFTNTQRIYVSSNTVLGLVFKGALNQLADYIQCQDNNSNILAKIDASGQGTFSGTLTSSKLQLNSPNGQGITVNGQTIANSTNTVYDSGKIHLGGGSYWTGSTAQEVHFDIYANVIGNNSWYNVFGNNKYRNDGASFLTVSPSIADETTYLGTKSKFFIVNGHYASANNANNSTFPLIGAGLINTNQDVVSIAAKGNSINLGGPIQSADSSSSTHALSVKNAGASYLLDVRADGHVYVNAGSAGSSSAQFEVTASSASTVGQAIYLSASQTEDAFRLVNHSGSTLTKFDSDGLLEFNFGSSGISIGHFLVVRPNDTYNGNFLFSLASFANNGTDPQPDAVLAIGYNTDGTTLNDPTKPGCSTNLESYYVPSGLLGGTAQFEYHTAQVHFVDGTIWRPWTVSIPYDKSTISHAVRASSISWEAPDGTQQILTTWPTIELKNNTVFLQNVNNLAWLNQRATDGSSNISLAMVDNSDRTVFGQAGRAVCIPGSSVTIDNPLYVGSNVGVGTTNPNVSGQSSNVRVVTTSGTDAGGFGGFETNTLSTSVDALIGYYGFTASGQTANYRLPSFIGAWLEGSTAGKLGASLRFHTQPDNTAGAIERFRVTSNGYFLVNQTASGSASAQFEVTAATAGTVGQAIYLALGQTEDALRVVNNSGSTITKIDANGVLNVTGGLTIPVNTSNAITIGTSSGTAIAPLSGYSISLGNTYGSGTAGSNANMKLRLFDYSDPNENYGFGLSSALMEITTGSLADIGFFKNGATPAELMRIKNSGDVSVNGSVTTKGVILNRKTITTTTTLVATDNTFVAITSTGSAYTIALPAANAVPAGFSFTFKDEGGGAAANNITISPAGTDTTETALALTTNYQILRIYSDGSSKWFIM